MSEASYGAMSMTAAIWMGAIGLTIYVMISGIHGSAWMSVIKDSIDVDRNRIFRDLSPLALLWWISANV